MIFNKTIVYSAVTFSIFWDDGHGLDLGKAQFVQFIQRKTVMNT